MYACSICIFIALFRRYSDGGTFCTYKVCKEVPGCDCKPICSMTNTATKEYSCTYKTAAGGTCGCAVDKNVLCSTFASTAETTYEMACTKSFPTLSECGEGQQCHNMLLQNKTYLALFSQNMISGYSSVLKGASLTRLLNCAVIKDLTMVMEVSVCGRNL